MTRRALRRDRRSRSPAPLLAACVLVALLPATSDGASGGREAPGTLHGRVTSADDGAPVEGATVLLETTPLAAVTGPEGEYRFESLPPGRYRLRVVAFGYREERRHAVEVPAGGSRRVDVALEPAAVEVPGVVVTASRSRARPGESPASVSVVTERELEARNVLTPEDALRFAPGVAFNRGQIDVRGAVGVTRGLGSRVLVLVDGHRMLGGITGDADFGTLPVRDVERIEVVKGPASALYGTNALGGVVNLITSPVPREPRTEARGHLGAYDLPAGVDFTDEALTFEGVELQHGRRIGRLGVRVYGARHTTDGFHENGRTTRWLFRSKLVHPAGGRRPWRANVIYEREERQEFFGGRSADHLFEIAPRLRGDRVETDKAALGIRGVVAASPGVVAEVGPYLYYAGVRNHLTDNDDFHRSVRAGATFQLSLAPWRGHAVTVGGEAAVTSASTDFLVRNPVLWDLALYVQDEARIAPGVRATGGVRLDIHDPVGAPGEFAASPKVGVVAELARGVGLRASVGRGYRAPSAVERFVSTEISGFRVAPNPLLEGETAWATEVGLTAELGGRVWVDAAYFRSAYDGLIEPAGTLVDRMTILTFQNVEDATIEGVDVTVKSSLVPGRLGVDAGYVHLATEEERTGRPLPYRSRHQITATARGEVAGVAWGLDFRYRTAPRRVLLFPLDERDDIALVDLRLSREIGSWGIRAKVSNVLQHRYVDIQERHPGPPRSVLLSVVSEL